MTSPSSRQLPCLAFSLQDGVLAAEEVAGLRALPQAEDALCLRRFDEGEKAAGLTAPPAQHFLLYVAAF